MNLLIRVISYFLGTLRLKISGEYCERFLNILAANSVSFWSPYVTKNDFFITVLKKDIKKIRILRRNTGIKIKITKRHGFPLIVNRYKSRYGLILGAIIFIAVLSLLSKGMWNVKIIGEAQVEEGQVVEFLKANNVKYGSIMKNIDTDILKQKMLLSFDNLAWVSLNKQGCVLEVNMTEFESKKHLSSPQNIVAECDGVIRRINASKGSVNVKIGDTVVKNQVLVSGILSYGYENNFVEPQAEILAEIKYFKKITVEKRQKSIVYNGKEKNRYSIEIMGLKIPLFFKDEQNLHKTEKSERKLSIFGGEIPIKIYKDKSLYYNEFTYEIDRQKAEKTANEMLKKHFKEINAECKDIDLIDTKETNGGFTFEYSITCIKDIGVKKIIEFS